MFRVVLLWLLILALPAQGATAATMLFCGADHHDGVPAASMPHDAGILHSHASATHAPHDATAATDSTAAADKAASSQLHKCSVCASCCSPAAIHDTVPKLRLLEPVAVHFATLAPAIEPFAADGPERPPRHPLA